MIRSRVHRACIDSHDLELPRLQHPGELPVPLPYREFSSLVVPVEVDRASLPLLIVVIRAFILIQREVSIRAGVDTDLQVVGRLLTSVLLDRAYRNDAPSPDQYRYSLQRSVDVGSGSGDTRDPVQKLYHPPEVAGV